MSKIKILVVAALFMWTGFIGAISFMEAWLKFKAHGVTLPIGLSIGKVVFGALNTMECFFAVVVLIGSFFIKNGTQFKLLLLVVLSILVLQSIWLLPALDARADAIIADLPLPPSLLHTYFIGMEMLKFICLIFLGVHVLKRSK